MEKFFSGNLFEKGDVVAVALSGGRDSVCLFDLLLKNAAALGITVKAVNVDHGIRGERSQEDSAFVARLCEKKGVELFFRRYDCLKYALENGLGQEEAARKLRYECFAEAKESGFCDKIATAHHLSDNAETVLFNLFRGTSVARGIAKERAYIVRPLLGATRDEIDAYALENGLEFVEDETNDLTDYSRNYVRLKIIPAIKERFPQFEKAIGRLSEISESEDAFLNGLAEKAVKEKGDCLSVSADEPECIFARACVIALNRSGVVKDYEKTHIDALKGLRNACNGAEISLPQGLKAIREYGEITFYRRSLVAKSETPYGEGEFNIRGVSVRIGAAVAGEGKTLFFDGDKMPSDAVLRTRRSGDLFEKFGGGTKKLNDYFTDVKIPKRARDRVPLVCSGKRVLIVCGKEIADEIKTTEKTKKIVGCALGERLF